MSSDFVAEAGSAIVRMKAQTRKRQLYVAVGGALGTISLLYWCGGLGFVVMIGAVVALLYLEFYGTKLEAAMETIGSDEGREFFVSSRDGLFVATQQLVFVEKVQRMFRYEDETRSVDKVEYDAAGHQLVLQISVRHPAMAKANVSPRQQRIEIAFPRSMNKAEGERVAKRVALWAESGTEQTLP